MICPECNIEMSIIEKGDQEVYFCPYCGKEYKETEFPLSLTEKELVELNIPTPEYIVEGIVVDKSFFLLGAPQKSYKTYTMVYMGMCIANGIDFLGHKTKQKNVLYCDCESSHQLAQKRLMEIKNGGLSDTENFIYDFTEYDLNSEEDIEKIIEKVKENNIEVVIFDVLRGYLKDIKENSADDMREWYISKLKKLLKMGITVIVLTHTRKTRPEDSTLDKLEKIRGSTEVTTPADMVFMLDRKGFENYADFLCLKNKYGLEIAPIGILFDFDTNNASLKLSTTDREIWLLSKATSYVKPMWEWLLEREKEVFTTKDFKEQLKHIGVDKGRDMVSKRVLDDLMSMGKVNKVKRGVYQRVLEKV